MHEGDALRQVKEGRWTLIPGFGIYIKKSLS